MSDSKELNEFTLADVAGGFYQDKQLQCKNCGKTFILSAEKQRFYSERGFINESRLCDECKQARYGQRPMFAAVCAKCGKEIYVPFKPLEGRPIYCQNCLDTMNHEV